MFTAVQRLSLLLTDHGALPALLIMPGTLLFTSAASFGRCVPVWDVGGCSG
jgi:hypothetical protein